MTTLYLNHWTTESHIDVPLNYAQRQAYNFFFQNPKTAANEDISPQSQLIWVLS